MTGWAPGTTPQCSGISASRPGERRAGIGSALFRAAGSWARTRGCEWLTIETQNVNAAACHFYQKMGCTLGAIDRFAYPGLPGEVQLRWWKVLARDY
jgi:GNAT superfamily N-acetyltransferase